MCMLNGQCIKVVSDESPPRACTPRKETAPPSTSIRSSSAGRIDEAISLDRRMKIRIVDIIWGAPRRYYYHLVKTCSVK